MCDRSLVNLHVVYTVYIMKIGQDCLDLCLFCYIYQVSFHLFNDFIITKTVCNFFLLYEPMRIIYIDRLIISVTEMHVWTGVHEGCPQRNSVSDYKVCPISSAPFYIVFFF